MVIQETEEDGKFQRHLRKNGQHILNVKPLFKKEAPMGSPMFQLFSKIRACRMALVA